MKKKQQKEKVELKAVIPDGNPLKWSTFYADRFDPLWSDGKVGSEDLRRFPCDTEKLKMLTNISAALKKIDKYRQELVDASYILLNK